VKVLSSSPKKGFKVLDLHRERANRKEFESMLKKFSPSFVVLNGHSSHNTVCGHKNQPLLIANKNERLLKSKIVYAISCSSAKTLGPKSIEAGAISYTGYDDDFIFAFSRIFVSSILKGNSVRDSYKKAKEILKNNILKLLSSESQDTALVRFLWWDMKHFVTHGNEEGKL